MRTLIALALVAGPAMADAHNSDGSCRTWSEMARSVMTARQSGVPAVQAMEHYVEQSRPDHRDYYRDLVIAAYRLGRWQTDDVRTAAIVDFADQVWIECMTATAEPDLTAETSR